MNWIWEVEIALSLGSTSLNAVADCVSDGDGATVWSKELNMESFGAGMIDVEIAQRDAGGNRGSVTSTIERTEGAFVTVAGDLPDIDSEQ